MSQDRRAGEGHVMNSRSNCDIAGSGAWAMGTEVEIAWST
jgi:hypothetical protein